MTGNAVVERSVTAQNQFTDALTINAKQRASISISGTFAANVELQRNLDGTNWRTVDTYTALTELTYVADETCDIRLGVPTGGFTSGPVNCRLGLGQ